MPWSDWLALKHPVLVHVPVAVAILLPWALLAAQRPGRGLKPWWLTCRYLAWAGMLVALAAMVSGLLNARHQGLLGPNGLLAGADQPVLRLHQLAAVGSFVAGILTLRVFFRRREEHQGFGFLALLFGLAWCALLLLTGWFGALLGRAREPQAIPAIQATAPTPAPPADPARDLLRRVLDHTALLPMHAEPVRSPLHGHRWVRAWVSPGAEEAYRRGAVLPEGALVVLSSLEDRYGRPGWEPGPLTAMTVKDGKVSFLLYWARVPEAKRGETGGAEAVTWRGDDPGLSGCLTCHADGLAPRRDRSTWTVPRPKPKVEPAPEAGR